MSSSKYQYRPLLPSSVGNNKVYFLRNEESNGDPDETQDENAGFLKNSLWINTSANQDGVYICMDASAGAAKWLRTPTLIYAFEGFTAFNTNQPDGNWYVNFGSTHNQANGSLSTTTGYRSQLATTLNPSFNWFGFSPDQAVASTRTEYDPLGLRDAASPGFLNVLPTWGEGFYRIHAVFNHPPNEANAKYTTDGFVQNGVGLVSVGIQLGKTGTVSNTIDQTIEYSLFDNFTGPPETASFNRVVYIKENPLRVTVSFDNPGTSSGEVYGFWLTLEKLN